MAKRSSFKNRIEFLAVKALLGTLGALPRNGSIFLSTIILKTILLVLAPIRKAGMRNLEIAFPELSEHERRRLLFDSMKSLGRLLGDLSRFARMSREQLEDLVEFDHESDQRLLDRYELEKQAGRGVIVASPHLGNWEIGVLAYSALREPLSYLARPLDNDLVDDLLSDIRARFGNRAINKRGSLMAASAILGSGGVLGILPDVNVQEKDGVFVPYFGIPACTGIGLAMVALRTNSLIVPMCTVWVEERSKYVLRYSDIIEPLQTGNRDEDIRRITAEVTLALEKFVRAYPEQWFMLHRRWKTRPKGEPGLY